MKRLVERVDKMVTVHRKAKTVRDVPITSELEAVIRGIKKSKGDQTVMRASELRQPFRIRTNIFMLDYALLGGIPFNRTTMFHGKKHSGKSTACDKVIASAQRSLPDQKCVKIDTEGCIAWYERILDTATGFVYTAEQIFRRKIPMQVASFDEATGKLVTKPITSWFDNGVKEVLRVSTVGTSGDFTENHRFLVYSGKGMHEWLRSDELEPGMLVCRPRHQTYEWAATSKIGVDASRLMGYLLGDGHFGDNGVGFTNIDGAAIDDVRSLCAGMNVDLIKVDDRHYRIARDLLGEAYTKHNENPIRTLLRDLHLYGKTGADKFIPSDIMTGTEEDAAACLTGLYMSDGTVNRCRPTTTLSTISLEMAEQIRHLWSRFGVVARITKWEPRKDTHSMLYVVTINGLHALRKVASTLTLRGYKREQLHGWANTQSKAANGKELGAYYPELFTLTSRERSEVRKEYENATGLYWEQITTIERVGAVQTYDFTVADTHNLVVNDMVVHNTHDDVWSKKNGVNTDELVLVQPDTGEDAVDIAVGLVHARETSLIVVDSLASLVPYKEVEGSAEDEAIPGLQAKLITRMLRRITMAQIQERKRGHFVSFLVTNQHRAKIGGWSPSGDPRSLPGGQALGHFTSVEVLFKNKEIIKSDGNGAETLAYNEHAFTIEKNKHNAGTRTGEYVLLRRDNEDLGLEEGDVDDAATMLAFAKRLGWYSGGGKGGFTLAFADVEEHYDNGEQAVLGLYADRRVYESLRIQLIVQNAIKQKMPEDFIDYLLGN